VVVRVGGRRRWNEHGYSGGEAARGEKAEVELWFRMWSIIGIMLPLESDPPGQTA
jgi:hypothetical protein